MGVSGYNLFAYYTSKSWQAVVGEELNVDPKIAKMMEAYIIWL